jgi:hypothetical protein
MLWKEKGIQPEVTKRYLANFYYWLGKYFQKAHEPGDGEINPEKLGDIFFVEKSSKEWWDRRRKNIEMSIERWKNGMPNLFKTKKEFVEFIKNNGVYEGKYGKYWDAFKEYWIDQTYNKLINDEGAIKLLAMSGESPVEKAREIQEAGEEGEKLILDILRSKYPAEHTPKIDDYFGTGGDIYLPIGEGNSLSKILAIDVMVYENKDTVENIINDKKLKNLGFKDFSLDLPKKIANYLDPNNENFVNDLTEITKDGEMKFILSYLNRIKDRKNKIEDMKDLAEFLDELKKSGYNELVDLVKKKTYEYITSMLGNYQASVNPITFLEAGIDNKVHKILVGFSEKEIEELKTMPKEEGFKYVVDKIKKSIEDFKNFAINVYLFLRKYKDQVVDFILPGQNEFNLLENIKNFDKERFIKELEEKAKSEDIKERRWAENILKTINKIKSSWNEISSSI